jgi:hypothetical protein
VALTVLGCTKKKCKKKAESENAARLAETARVLPSLPVGRPQDELKSSRSAASGDSSSNSSSTVRSSSGAATTHTAVHVANKKSRKRKKQKPCVSSDDDALDNLIDAGCESSRESEAEDGSASSSDDFCLEQKVFIWWSEEQRVVPGRISKIYSPKDNVDWECELYCGKDEGDGYYDYDFDSVFRSEQECEKQNKVPKRTKKKK